MVDRGRMVKRKLPKLGGVETVGLSPASHKDVGFCSQVTGIIMVTKLLQVLPGSSS